jgi:DNA polymerase theta
VPPLLVHTQVGAWLDAAVFVGGHRPVPLTEYVKDGTRLLNHHGEVVRELSVPPGWPATDPNHLGLLVQETVQQGHSVMVFCATVKGTVAAAVQLARMVSARALSTPSQDDDSEAKPAAAAEAAAAAAAAAGAGGAGCACSREQLSQQLQQLPEAAREDVSTLAQLVAQGVAFYNSALPCAAKDLVEMGCRAGVRALRGRAPPGHVRSRHAHAPRTTHTSPPPTPTPRHHTHTHTQAW